MTPWASSSKYPQSSVPPGINPPIPLHSTGTTHPFSLHYQQPPAVTTQTTALSKPIFQAGCSQLLCETWKRLHIQKPSLQQQTSPPIPRASTAPKTPTQHLLRGLFITAHLRKTGNKLPKNKAINRRCTGRFCFWKKTISIFWNDFFCVALLAAT